MCMSSNTPPPPPAPPPPPPVLDQTAPESAAPKTSESLANTAMGTKKYRTSNLGINSNGSGNNTTQAGGLSIK